MWVRLTHILLTMIGLNVYNQIFPIIYRRLVRIMSEEEYAHNIVDHDQKARN